MLCADCASHDRCQTASHSNAVQTVSFQRFCRGELNGTGMAGITGTPEALRAAAAAVPGAMPPGPHWGGRRRRPWLWPLPASSCSASAPHPLRLPSARAHALASNVGCPQTSALVLEQPLPSIIGDWRDTGRHSREGGAYKRAPVLPAGGFAANNKPRSETRPLRLDPAGTQEQRRRGPGPGPGAAAAGGSARGRARAAASHPLIFLAITTK
jgi:hypothetical protein